MKNDAATITHPQPPSIPTTCSNSSSSSIPLFNFLFDGPPCAILNFFVLFYIFLKKWNAVLPQIFSSGNLIISHQVISPLHKLSKKSEISFYHNSFSEMFLHALVIIKRHSHFEEKKLSIQYRSFIMRALKNRYNYSISLNWKWKLNRKS